MPITQFKSTYTFFKNVIWYFGLLSSESITLAPPYKNINKYFLKALLIIVYVQFINFMRWNWLWSAIEYVLYLSGTENSIKEVLSIKVDNPDLSAEVNVYLETLSEKLKKDNIIFFTKCEVL